jgi:hypothetical protein
VTQVEYPPNPKREFRPSGFRDVLQATLPDLAPGRGRPKEEGPETSRGGAFLDDGEEPRSVQPGKDELLNFVMRQETPAGRDRTIRLWLRFFTAEELAAVGD